MEDSSSSYQRGDDLNDGNTSPSDSPRNSANPSPDLRAHHSNGASNPNLEEVVLADNERTDTARLLKSSSTHDSNGTYIPSESDPSTPLKGRNTLLNVCSFIILNEFCERMAFYGFQGSLVLFLQRELGFSPGAADTQSSLWNGACYLTPLLGAYLADSHMGRFKSIMLFICIYFLGMLGVTLTAQKSLSSSAAFFIALYVVALGTGGIKPNVSTFGADQFDETNAEDRKQLEGFFSWFYLSINLGAFISYTIIAYLCQNVSFDIGYAIPTVAMFFAIITFYSGRKRYKMLPPSGSILTTFCKIIIHALYRKYKSKKPLPDSVILSGHGRRVGEGLLPPSTPGSPYLGIDHSSPSQNHWLDYAKIAYGGQYTDQQVNDVLCVVRLIPFLLLFIVYWAIYNQMNTSFFNQGCQMNLAIGSLTMPVSALNLFDTLVIIILIPLFEKFLYPFLKRLGYRLTMLRKIGVGFFFAILSMCVAALIEMKRLEQGRNGDTVGPSICFSGGNPPVPQMSSLSVFAQIPQFVLIGTSEVLASVTGIELFYDQAPENMRSVCAALNLVTTALGNWLSAALIPLVNSGPNGWITHDANDGHLNYFFWLLAGLMALNTLVFIWVANGYQYKSQPNKGKAQPNVNDDTLYLNPSPSS